jgi:hypothetical protein
MTTHIRMNLTLLYAIRVPYLVVVMKGAHYSPHSYATITIILLDTQRHNGIRGASSKKTEQRRRWSRRRAHGSNYDTIATVDCTNASGDAPPQSASIVHCSAVATLYSSVFLLPKQYPSLDLPCYGLTGSVRPGLLRGAHGYERGSRIVGPGAGCHDLSTGIQRRWGLCLFR